jgi:hypothetical protein
MGNLRDAEKAVCALHGMPIGGRHLTVHITVEKVNPDSEKNKSASAGSRYIKEERPGTPLKKKRPRKQF